MAENFLEKIKDIKSKEIQYSPIQTKESSHLDRL